MTNKVVDANGEALRFDDDKKPVSIYAPPPPSPEVVLLDDLADAGAIVPWTPEVYAAIRKFSDSEQDEAGLKALKQLAIRLPDWPELIVLRHVIQGGEEASIREAAKQAGMSKDTFHRRVICLRDSLFG